MVISFQCDVAYLRCVGSDADAQLSQGKFCQGSTYASSNGDAGRRAASTTMVAYAILIIIGIVGMRRTEQASHVLIVLRVLVGVAYFETDRCSRTLAFEHTTEKLHLVGFVA